MELTGKQIKRLVFFLLFVIVLMACLNRVTPCFFRMLPNDYARTKLILNTIRDTTQTPEVVIFGNSRGMSGVDGYLLERELSDHPVVYSFTSTGQKLSESALYYTSLPASVKTVIQCLDIDALSKPLDMDIPNQVALHMYGYKMDDQTKLLVPALYDELNKSDWYYNYKARNCLFSGFSFVLRNLLDDDAPENSIDNELRYPASQASYRNEAVYQRGLDEQNKENKFEAYEITAEWKRLLEESYAFFKAKNIQYYLVLMPYNPDIISAKKTEKQEALQSYINELGYIPYINCFDLLEASDFYDAIHPNDKGAKKITRQILISLP
ncbi:hypothetical protein HMPREF1212_04355 [Parabacteroides sp. HGS0025]|uniref:SGNH/GDSL hydrolase family protein n=1 Tax=Parabacteroides sp. HGS0025 TaxID=1078087 RepID=UPI0006171A2A|nr:SGNH/GDSL hydrolase family protein [Parabacteroides sp. HGS0025]KKB46859.1 hypothetical protein HMPREF1212_04355 [Parabacteroides sp. HGS0025]